MTSFLIIHKDSQTRKEYAISLTENEHIDPLDITLIELETSLGIEDVRIIQKKIFLKPFKGDQKAIIVSNAHTASIEAQNALLKVLEEPPAHTLFILTAESKQNFLPTIISRCTIISLDEVSEPLSEDILNTIKEEFTHILSIPIGEKLKKATDIAADKIATLKWTEQMMHMLRQEMVKTNIFLVNESRQPQPDYIQILKAFQKTYTLIQSTNVSTRFAIENLLLTVS